MKVAAVIAEFNPFHNGHAKIIRSAREMTGADHILILMSGDYVQRGAPAVLDRHTRALAALKGGADLVISQPTRYCTSSAENYALSSIRLLNALNVVDHLVFGSESGELSEILSAANFFSQETDGYRRQLLEYQKSGLSYPKARALAAPEKYNALLSSPNNVLGVEYIKALIRTRSAIEPLTVKRIGADHGDTDYQGEYASASAIRKLLEESESAEPDSVSDPDGEIRQIISRSVPELPLAVLSSSAAVCGVVKADDFSYLLAEKVWGAESPEYFMQFMDVTPDLAKAIYNRKTSCSSFDSFAEILKNKSVTRTHINRALLHIVLGIQADHTETLSACTRDVAGSEHTNSRCRQPGPDETYDTLFAHVLGCRSSASALLGELCEKSHIPILTRPAAEIKKLAPSARAVLNEEIRVSNLYNAVRAVKKRQTVTNTLSRKFIRI